MAGPAPRRPGHAALLLLGVVALLATGAVLWFFLPHHRRTGEPWLDPSVPPPEFASAMAEFDAGRFESGRAELAGYSHRWQSPVWDRRACDLLAFRAAQRQEFGAALEALERRPVSGVSGQQVEDPLAGPSSALRASLLRREGRAAEAAAAAISAGALDPSRNVSGEDALETWARSADPAEAVEKLERLIGAGSMHALEHFALIRAELMPAGKRVEALKTVWIRFPGTRAAAEAIETLQEETGPGNGWSASDLPAVRDRALALMRSADPAEARATWEFAREAIPALANHPALLTGLGAALAAQGDLAGAAAILPQRVGDAALSNELALARARIAIGRRRLREAADALRPAMSASAPPEERSRAYLLLADALEQAGRDAEALTSWRSGLALVPPSPGNDPVRWKAALTSLKLHRFAEATSLLTPLDRPEARPGYQAASLFWRARAAESTRSAETARRLYQETHARFRNDYYGIRAAVRLGLAPVPTARLDGPRPVTPGASADAPPSPLRPGTFTPPARAAVAAAAEFELLHLGGPAGDALEFALRASPSGGGASSLRERLADLALARGDKVTASELVRAAYPSLVADGWPSLPRRFAGLLYPVGDAPDLDREARAAGLDPNLLRGLILQESDWDPQAVSRVGALGLMQVMPDTGRELARSLGLRGFSRESLFEPAVNIRLGTRHFTDLLARYGGRIEPALAAYNAGASRVDRWWPAARGDVERFVEEIPFIETRLYVKRIASNRRMYTLLYGVPAGS